MTEQLSKLLVTVCGHFLTLPRLTISFNEQSVVHRAGAHELSLLIPPERFPRDVDQAAQPGIKRH